MAIPRRYVVTTKDNGVQLKLGDAGDTAMVATYAISWVPDATFSGTGLQIQGRVTGVDAHNDNVPYVPVPYKKAYLNGLVGDYTMVVDGTKLSAYSIVEVPANALALIVVPSITAGFGTLYTFPLTGPSTN